MTRSIARTRAQLHGLEHTMDYSSACMDHSTPARDSTPRHHAITPPHRHTTRHPTLRALLFWSARTDMQRVRVRTSAQRHANTRKGGLRAGVLWSMQALL